MVPSLGIYTRVSLMVGSLSQAAHNTCLGVYCFGVYPRRRTAEELPNRSLYPTLLPGCNRSYSNQLEPLNDSLYLNQLEPLDNSIYLNQLEPLDNSIYLNQLEPPEPSSLIRHSCFFDFQQIAPPAIVYTKPLINFQQIAPRDRVYKATYTLLLLRFPADCSTCNRVHTKPRRTSICDVSSVIRVQVPHQARWELTCTHTRTCIRTLLVVDS